MFIQFKWLASGRVNGCFYLSMSAFFVFCYWQMQDKWMGADLADVVLKLQIIGLGVWVIWRRTYYVAKIVDDYLIIYQLPFKTILRLDEINRLWCGDDWLRVEMINGTELNRYYLFAVLPRLQQRYALQKLIVLN